MKITKNQQEWEGQMYIETSRNQLQTVKHLGVLINRDGKMDEEMRNRINKANRVYYHKVQHPYWKKGIEEQTEK